MEIAEQMETAVKLHEKVSDMIVMGGDEKAVLTKVLTENFGLSPENAAATTRKNLTLEQLALSQPSVLFPPDFVS